MNRLSLQTSIVWLLCAVMAGVALQGPISVLAQVHANEYALLFKSWKEILLGVAGLLLFLALLRSGRTRELFCQKIVWLVGAIGALHVLLLVVFDNQYVGEVAALLIDVRMYLLFIEIYIAVFLWPSTQKAFMWAAGVGLAIIAVFSLLQTTILPRDVLSHLGYSKATIQPYLTVDLNDDYVRINSTLRGPNPLGAIAILTLTLGAAVVLRRSKLAPWQRWVMWLVMIGSLVALWSSYSRSAWLGAMAAAAVLAVAVGIRRISRTVLLGSLCALVILTGSVLALKDTPVIQNIVFHTNPDSPTVHKSDDGHLDSLEHGTEAMLGQPFGAGLGSTGSASLLTDKPVIIENQYFYMAHESGWLGLALQLWLFIWVLLILWHNRMRALSLALLASGVGMAVIALVLPVWADDTVALMWWGLAGVAVAGYYNSTIKAKGSTDARAPHKKTTRTI